MKHVYIIDTYNKYDRNINVVHTFFIDGRPYCIREVTLEWGEPQFQENNAGPGEFCLYNTLEDALQYVEKIRAIR